MSMVPGDPCSTETACGLYSLGDNYLILDEAGEAGDDEDDGRDQDVKVGVERGGG